MSKFRNLVENILLHETNQPKFNLGDIVKTKPLINNTSSIGTIANSFIVRGITIYNVKFIIPNISGPYEDRDGNIIYTRINEKPYATKVRQIAEEFLEPGTEKELNAEIEKAAIETEKWK
jgi:hypothetical protein